MKMTVKEFSTMNGTTALVANAVLKALSKLGAIVELESIKSGKGRPTKVYEVPEDIVVCLPAGKVSAETFAVATGIDKVTSSSFLKFLGQTGCIVKLAGETVGKGRPTNYFELPDSVAFRYDVGHGQEHQENSEEEKELEIV